MKKNKILAAIAILLFIAILVIVGYLINTLNTTTIEEHSFMQYFVGQKFEYEGGLKLTRKNDISEIVINNQQVSLDSTPIYYTDIENKVIFPEDMEIVFPMQEGLIYKIKYFSNIFYDEDTAYLEDTENRALQNAFLYDGQDLYFFIENTTLQVDGETFELTPLSYVICDYQNGVEIYQKAEDKYTILEGEAQEVLASTEDYTINLKTDSLQIGEKQQLLIRNISRLQNY